MVVPTLDRIDQEYCCQQFAEKVEETSGEFERDSEGGWNIGGCCGGGCYVVEKMEFCPFCGARLSDADSNNVKEEP